MDDPPEAIRPPGEMMSRRGRLQSWVDPAEEHSKPLGHDVGQHDNHRFPRNLDLRLWNCRPSILEYLATWTNSASNYNCRPIAFTTFPASLSSSSRGAPPRARTAMLCIVAEAIIASASTSVSSANSP